MYVYVCMYVCMCVCVCVWGGVMMMVNKKQWVWVCYGRSQVCLMFRRQAFDGVRQIKMNPRRARPSIT